MALATGTALALAGALGSAGLSYMNTRNAANRQDREAARGIEAQSRIQQKADAKVNDQVTQLEGSTAETAREARTADFMQQLAAARKNTDRGLDATGMGERFTRDAAGARTDLQEQGATTAGLLAGIDAAGIQRQAEGTQFGNLATDIGLIGRESSGQNFLTELRTRAAGRRNPWMDAGASLLSGLSTSGLGAGAGAGASAASAGAAASGLGAGLYGGLTSSAPKAAGLTMPSNDMLIAAMRGYGQGGL